jgi:hypothetical protein
MDALRQSIASDASKKPKKPRKAAAGQKEMLLPSKAKAAQKRKPQSQSVRRIVGRLVRNCHVCLTNSSVAAGNSSLL